MDEDNFAGVLDIDLCGSCKLKSTKKCSGCNLVSYCDKGCQRRNRKQHCSLMQCSSENVEPMLEENKILFEELLEAQAVLTYAFLGEGLDFGEHEDHIKNLLRRRTQLQIPRNLTLNISGTLKEILHKKLFQTYRGNVYYHHSCFGMSRDYHRMSNGHLPTQLPVLITREEETAQLTPNLFLEKIAFGVMLGEDDEIEQHVNGEERPIFTCRIHRDLEEIQVYQIKSGVLIIVNCM